MKRSTHEGGIRIPFLAKGPRVPRGVVNDHQLAFYDIMPTLLDYAGLDGSSASRKSSTREHPYDGISFCPTLTGHDRRQQRHEFLYWEFHETDMIGLRMGNWKLVVKSGRCALYDLSKDIHEDHDLSTLYPRKLRRMVSLIRREHTDHPLFPITLPQSP